MSNFPLTMLQRASNEERVSMSWPHHALQWHHNGRSSVSNHQPHDCLLNHLFRRRSKKASKLHVTGLCVGNSLGTGEFPAQMASNAENVSIWWRHHWFIRISLPLPSSGVTNNIQLSQYYFIQNSLCNLISDWLEAVLGLLFIFHDISILPSHPIII